MITKPCIFWGIDDYASEIVRHFVGSLQHQNRWTDVNVAFDSKGDNPVAEFRNTLVKLRESVRSQNIPDEPRVLLFSASSDPKGKTGLDLLKQVSQALEEILPGSQSMILVALFPPQTVDDREKADSFGYFLELEKIVYEIPFLNLVFVNQLPTDLNSNPAEEDVIDDALCELLSRELTEKDLDNIIQEFGCPAIRNRFAVGGRRCCYSTAGAHKLIYYCNECIKYLETMFQQELFEKGFMDIASISDNKRKLAPIQLRADNFVKNEIAHTESDIRWDQLRLAHGLERLLDFEGMEDQIAGFEQGAWVQVDRAMSEIKQVPESLRKRIRQQFLDHLGASPEYLAGGKLYMEALQGRRIFSPEKEDEKQPSGVNLFGLFMCINPFIQSAQKVLEPHIREVLLQSEVTVNPKENEDFAAWLVRLVDHAKPKIQGLPVATASHANFLLQSAEVMLQHLTKGFLDFPKATELMSDLISRFSEEAEKLRRIVKENRQTRKETEEEGPRLKREYGIFKRILSRKGRTEYKEKEAERRKGIENLDKELDSLRNAFSKMRDLFVELMDNVILPHTIRAMLNQAFREEVEEIAGKFDRFVSAIEESLEETWSQASKITEFTKPTAATVLNKNILDILYKGILDERNMSDLSKESLEFFPPGSESEIKKLSYHGCRDINDHFLAGSGSLLDRMQGFAKKLFKPIQRKDVLDIIEVEGHEAAYKYLKDKIESTKKFLDFAPGFIPSVEEQGKMNSILVVRTAKSIGRRLEAEYQSLLWGEPRFIDNKNDDVIDMTCLIFGFPAFLIHGLSECRERYHDIEEIDSADSADLWPVFGAGVRDQGSGIRRQGLGSNR